MLGRMLIERQGDTRYVAKLASHQHTQATNAWAQRSPLPEPLAYAAGAVGPDDHTLWVFGGCNACKSPCDPASCTAVSNNVYVYDAVTDHWEATLEMPVGWLVG